MIGGAIWEILYTTKVYEEIHSELVAVQESFSRHEDVYNEESLALTNEVYETWQKSKETLFCLGNHNVLRTIDEKIVSLKAMVDTNYTDDAKIMLEVTLELIEAIQNDAVPNATNLL